MGLQERSRSMGTTNETASFRQPVCVVNDTARSAGEIYFRPDNPVERSGTTSTLSTAQP
jgi:hypothetical protein